MGGATFRGGRDEPAIAFEGVSRRFLLRHEARSSFQDWFIGLLHPRGKGEEFWALRDVSFAVRRGEAMGVLGRNGAGKSTLLKLVTRILEPTAGRIVTNGRVHAMLELGAGFHPELSGRDNVFLNGSLYGFSRRQMAERFSRIVEFAELEQFIDTPVKHFSSGMFMRLGFAIAVHMDPDILVIDEVLAVGDAAFQRKGYDVLQDLKAAGTTILFVSHSAEQVRSFCDRAVLLQKGQLIDIGPAGDVVDHYQRLLRQETAEATLLRVRPIDPEGLPLEALRSGDDLGIEVLLRMQSDRSPAGLMLALDLYDRRGVHLFGSTGQLPDDLPSPAAATPDTRRARAMIRDLPLAVGPITVAVTLQRPGEGGLETLDRQETEVDVSPRADGRGMLRLDHAWDWETPESGEVEASPAIRAGLWRGH